jgi:hypothetical protein
MDDYIARPINLQELEPVLALWLAPSPVPAAEPIDSARLTNSAASGHPGAPARRFPMGIYTEAAVMWSISSTRSRRRRPFSR